MHRDGVEKKQLSDPIFFRSLRIDGKCWPGSRVGSWVYVFLWPICHRDLDTSKKGGTSPLNK